MLPLEQEDGSTDEEAEQLRTCTAQKMANRMNRSFSIASGVRCPGSGCLFRSGRCNSRSTTLRYEAIAGYSIIDYQFVQGATHYGNTGGLSVTTDTNDDAESIAITLSCDAPDYPGAPGGWNRGELRGTISYMKIEELKQRAETECREERIL